MARNIVIKTVSEEIDIRSSDATTLQEVLRAKHLPPSLFQGYLKKEKNVTPVPLTTILSTIPEDQKIELRCIRNTDFRDIIPQKIIYKNVKNPVTTIPSITPGTGNCIETLQEFNPESAREIIKEKVRSFMTRESQSNKLAVGISGGGDSNTLAQALKDFSEIREINITFFTIIFEPIWPASAAERASLLCQTHGLEHKIFSETDLKKLLRMKKSPREFYEEYCKKFGSNTNHFFGTYLISLVARRLCREIGVTEYALGFNREDLLADLLFSLVNGQKPLSFPVRSFGEIRLLMPLWDIPKTLLDACYPRYSLSNYDERAEDQSTFQRNLMYYLAHGVDDVYPNLGLSLMQGARRIFEGNWSELTHRQESDLYVSEYADPVKTLEVEAFLRKHFDSGEK